MNYRDKIYSSYLTNRTTPILDINNIRSATIWYEKEVLKFLPKNKEIQILELGCGSGYFLHTLKKRGYFNLTGIDLGDEQIKVAESLKVKKFIVQDDIFHFLREANKSYDLICAFDVLEHFYKDELLEVLELVYAHLKPQGLFIFRTPNGEGPFAGRFRYGDLTHELAFTRNSLAQVLKVAGFSECFFYPVKPLVHGIKSLGRRIIFDLFEKIMHLYLVAETGSTTGYILTQNLWGVSKK